MNRLAKYISIIFIPLLVTTPASAKLFDISALFKPPGRSQPRATVGGGVRGKACDQASSANDSYIAALVPAKEDAKLGRADKIVLAVRSKGLYGKEGTLIVTDNDEYLHEQKVTIVGDGIMGVEFDRIDELKPNKFYEWSFRVTCGELPDVNDPSTVSYLSLVEKQASQAKDAESKIMEDAQNGLWYNSLTNALKQENQEPLNQLLQSIDAQTPDESVYLVEG